MATIFEDLLNAPDSGSPPPGPLTEQAAQSYGSIADRITQILAQGAQPSLQDIGTALLRNAGGTQTYGQAIGELTQQRRQRELQNVELSMTAAESILKQSELQAAAGNRNAQAFRRALQLSGFDQLDPEHRARVIQMLDADPEDVTTDNALPKVSAAIAATAPAGTPQPLRIESGDQIITRLMDPDTGELLEEFSAPRFKADRPRVFEVDGQLVDETGRVVFEGLPDAQALDPVTLSEGAMLVDPATGRLIAENPREAARSAATALGKLRSDLAAGLITPEEFEAEKRRLQADEARNVQTATVRMPDGSFRTFDRTDPALGEAIRNGAVEVPLSVTGRTADDLSPIDATQSEREAAGFLSRMRAAEEIVSDLEGKGFAPGAGSAIAEALPFGAGNFLRTEEGQRYRQAANDWIRAKLRQESGAVIGEEEMASEFQTYFPQPGDSAAVIEQKRRARRQAEEAMTLGAGAAAPRGATGPGAAEAPALPTAPDGGVDAARLKTGRVYTMPTGERLRWTGTDFEVVR